MVVDSVPAPVTTAKALRLPSEAADAFFDFDLDDDNDEEPESPGSPIDECEYTRLIETATSTPQDTTAAVGGAIDITAGMSGGNSVDLESGYVCASPCDDEISLKSTDDSQYFDLGGDISEGSTEKNSLYFDCVDSKITSIPNGHVYATLCDSDSSIGESLPPSQSTDSNLTFAALSSTSCSTLQV